MSNFVWWCYILSFTCSLHFQWPWLFSKVTVVSNSFNRKFYVLIWLSWNFVELWIIASRSWIDHLFFLNILHKGDNRHISSFERREKRIFFLDTVKARSFWLCMIITLLGVYIFTVGLTTLTLFQDHRHVRNINCKLHV